MPFDSVVINGPFKRKAVAAPRENKEKTGEFVFASARPRSPSERTGGRSHEPRTFFVRSAIKDASNKSWHLERNLRLQVPPRDPPCTQQ